MKKQFFLGLGCLMLSFAVALLGGTGQSSNSTPAFATDAKWDEAIRCNGGEDHDGPKYNKRAAPATATCAGTHDPDANVPAKVHMLKLEAGGVPLPTLVGGNQSASARKTFEGFVSAPQLASGVGTM